MILKNRKLKYTFPRLGPSGYHALMISFRNLSGFEDNDVARFRFKVLSHLYRYGWRAASDAYEVKKSTLFDWKRTYEQSGRKLISLVPKSTCPHHTREMVVDWRLTEFIRTFRETFGNVGKDKLAIFLGAYAQEQGLASYKATKIGTIIKRRGYFFDSPAKRNIRRKLLSPRLKKSPRETRPGYLEMDSISLWVLNRKYYFVTVIDVVTRLAWCKLTTNLSGEQARQAFIEFLAHCPYPVRVVQTDNGSEFLGRFHQYLEKQGIAHQLIYPHSPRINGVVERFNRTVQEEFISRSEDLGTDAERFSQKLSDYLAWYNTQRPHYSLQLKSPLAYIQQLT